MHIPSGETSLLTLTSFDDALAQALHPSQDYDTEVWLYVPNHYSEYRYILGNKGKRPLICVGVNPSTAVPGNLDNTLKSVERIARFNGYDSFIMFNVYAQRATRPQDMDQSCNALLHRENMRAFDYILSLAPKPAIWAAWGAIIEARPYLPQCVRDMIDIGSRHGAQWFSAGRRSIKGHPHHPLYLRKDSALETFDISTYLDTLN